MKIYKITEASEYLGVSINTLKTLANIGVSTGEIPVGQSATITGRRSSVNNTQGEEGLPSDLGRFFQVP